MKKLNLLQKSLAFIIDTTVAVFLYQVLALLATYFYFIPVISGISLTWILYYFVSYNFFHKSIGDSLFSASIVVKKRRCPKLLRILLRECFASFPALLFWLTLQPRLSIVRTLLILLLYILISCIKAKIFGITVRRNATAHSSHPAFFKSPSFIYLIVIVSGCLARVINISATGDKTLINATVLDTYPRPTVHSVSNYVDFLETNRQNINDYILNLFDEYDHVILCERHHQEMTQYDMIYDLVTDRRFVDRIGVVFTEIGCADSREAYKDFTNISFPNDSMVEKGLASFMMQNQSVHLL